jgi:N-acetylglucosaminyl-diphospho-decaprenol L-rhamnosyltransferase
MLSRITAILVTFESAERIAEAINSIPKGVRTIVVDNASRDDTIKQAKLANPLVEIIANSTNEGFGRANNQGLEITETDYVVLQNPDAVWHEGALEAAINLFDEFPNVAALCAKRRDNEKERIYDVDFIGGVFFFRMSALKKIGFFDPKIFLFSEDIDICLRLRNAGFRVCRSALINMDHTSGGSSSIKNFNPLKFFIIGQSLAYFEIKHKGEFWGRIYMYFTAYRSLLGAVVGRKNLDNKRARFNGIMDYLKKGDSCLFDNELAKRGRANAS